MEIHHLDIVHRDFHPGNILKFNLDLEDNYIYISDFGLSKLITENIKNPQKNAISGVLPYIAPEVFSGGEYTKAADVYSFAFVAYEIITGIPPYHDASHDKDLDFDHNSISHTKFNYKNNYAILRCPSYISTHF